MMFSNEENANQRLIAIYKDVHNILLSSKDGTLIEKKILILIEKTCHNLKLTLTDDNDVLFLHVMSMSHDDYIHLKNEQGLLINFSEFPDQMANLLRQCNGGRMFLQLLSDRSQHSHLEFIERNDFKNLVHLRLNLTTCGTDEVMNHICGKLNEYKDTVVFLKSQTEKLKNEVYKQRTHNEMLEKQLSETEEQIKKECSEQIEKIRTESRTNISELEKTSACKDAEINSLNLRVKEVLKHNDVLKSQCNQNIRTMENMAMEIKRVEAETRSLKEHCMKIDQEYNREVDKKKQIEGHLRILEEALTEKNNIVKMTKDSLSNLLIENERLQQLLTQMSEQDSKNKVAIQKTSEDLIKANQIISQSSVKIEQLTSKVTLLSQISLKVEKENTTLQTQLTEKDKLIDCLKNELSSESIQVQLLKSERDKLQKSVTTKDENIAELKKLIEIQYQKLQKLPDSYQDPSHLKVEANTKTLMAHSTLPGQSKESVTVPQQQPKQKLDLKSAYFTRPYQDK